ncbi:hypothetical protein PR048_027749 [Dryococelus australis]|uniref:Uncharacterized protein n=1 Tax=Dryococelus australis TaxID=614101 RepID=A0ABQ9GHC7_9NEOP|nr:hypothetical protein PR048_027749 [Dryococelus australis]
MDVNTRIPQDGHLFVKNVRSKMSSNVNEMKQSDHLPASTTTTIMKTYIGLTLAGFSTLLILAYSNTNIPCEKNSSISLI